MKQTCADCICKFFRKFNSLFLKASYEHLPLLLRHVFGIVPGLHLILVIVLEYWRSLHTEKATYHEQVIV